MWTGLEAKMATFREAREALMLGNDLDLINDEELLLLYDVNTSKNLDIPYWKYDKFDLDSLSDDECKSEFRFLKRYLRFTRRVKSSSQSHLSESFFRVQ